MLIYPSRIDTDQTLLLDQELPSSILKLDEPLARQHGPVKVNLTVTRDGETLLVTGQVGTLLHLRCGRCAEWIDWPVSVPNFILLIEPPFPDIIDLTPYIREDILLDLPVVASCRLDSSGCCPLTGKIYLPAGEPPPITGQDAWKELDKLKDRTKE